MIEPDLPYGDAMLRVRADPKGGFRGIVVGRANEPRQHPTRAGLMAELQAMVRAADPLFVGIEGASVAWLIGNVVAAGVAVVASRVSHRRSLAQHRDDDPALDEPDTAAEVTEVGITLAEHSA